MCACTNKHKSQNLFVYFVHQQPVRTNMTFSIGAKLPFNGLYILAEAVSVPQAV